MIIAASFDTNDIDMWENRGLMYGDGVFETMRSKNQKLPLWSYHQQRLQQSLAYLQMDSPDFKAIEQAIDQESTHDHGVLRLTVFRQQQGRGYQPHSRHCDWLISEHPYRTQNRPLTLALANQRLSPQPMLNGLKHLNRLPQVLIAGELNSQKADDLLVLNYNDDVIETTCQNLILIKDNIIYTPDMQQCGVEGVALTWLKQQISMKTKKLSLTDIKQADAVMTANAVHGFRTVQSLKTLGTFQINHPICDRISSLWQQLID
jgi:4-amino-4-deoxychorismate lyase